MTFPGGGYPAPGQPQPVQGYGPPQPQVGGAPKLSLAQILSLVVAGLGLLNFFLGFAGVSKGSQNFFDVLSTVPALLLIAGLLSLKVVLPSEDGKPGLLPSAFSIGGALTVLFYTFSASSVGTGAILVLVFGLLQMVAAVVAYLFDAGILTPPQPKPQFAPPGGGYQPGGYNPPSGQFPQQPGYPPVGQAPGFPPAGQQPPSGAFPQQGQPGQPGQQPPPQFGQPTTFQPQQGQFGQAPGTPPGGYPQQG